MRNKLLFLLALAVCLIAGPVILAAPDGGLAITWWTVDGGGGRSTGGPYVLTGTAGQPDVYANDCGRYFLVTGFWTPPTGLTGSCEIFLPTVVK
ncbi:MAG: hypothetical protein KJ069_28465 [Anaerolineae bacterium]|nr:hypothetical protein [Anaerolineae bacterium]